MYTINVMYMSVDKLYAVPTALLRRLRTIHDEQMTMTRDVVKQRTHLRAVTNFHCQAQQHGYLSSNTERPDIEHRYRTHCTAHY